MILFIVAMAYAAEKVEIEACTRMVRWKIDENEKDFDVALASSLLNPEKVIDKIIAELFENCLGAIQNSEAEIIVYETADLKFFERLVESNLTNYTTQEKIELTQKQVKIIDELYEHTKNKPKPAEIPFAFYISLAILILIFIILKRSKGPSIKKMV